MTARIADPEVRLLAAIAATLKGDYVREGEADPWAGSPFAWIRALPSRQKGKIGEQLVSGWCAAKGLDVTAAGDSEADRIIGGSRVEVKFSTLWRTGIYKFQQIREQNYEYLVCLGVSPFDAHSWVLSKNLVMAYVIGHTPQHRGRAGTDTFWLSLDPAHPPDWLAGAGGKLGAAFLRLQAIAAGARGSDSIASG
jgi:hypothetical protein